MVIPTRPAPSPGFAARLRISPLFAALAQNQHQSDDADCHHREVGYHYQMNGLHGSAPLPEGKQVANVNVDEYVAP